MDLDELAHDRNIFEPFIAPGPRARDRPEPVASSLEPGVKVKRVGQWDSPAPLSAPDRPWDPPPAHEPASGSNDMPSGRWDPEAHHARDDELPSLVDDLPDIRDDLEQEDGMDIEAEDTSMVNYLVLAGADPIEAKHRVHMMRGRMPTTFMEVYGGGAINQCANQARRSLGLLGIGALDIRTTKPDGSSWDFMKRTDRRMAKELIEAQNPDWLIGSPPCTAFSIWNVGMNDPKMDKHKVKATIEEGRTHLNFVAKLYRKQMAKGKYFLHEHPASAISWKEDCISSIANNPSVHTVVAHQCMYGLTSPVSRRSSERLPALKPTRFMSNSMYMAEKLSLRCDKSHKHQQLIGGRAHDAAFYPLPLVKAILSGIQATRDADKIKVNSILDRAGIIQAVTDAAGTIPDDDTLANAPASAVVKVTGGVLPIGYHQENFKPRYVDEYTGEVLDPHLVKIAIMEELNYFNEKVWQIQSKESMFDVKDHVFVRSRWVLCNKGDAAEPDIRARLVACEVNKDGKNDNFFASTPPLEAKKLLFARFAKERQRGSEPLQLSFVDIRKAYFNGIPKRPVFIQFPKELGLPTNVVGKLVRCAYGTRDAGAIWEDTYRGALEEMGFISGMASPCCFFHPQRKLHLVVHGDDFHDDGR